MNIQNIHNFPFPTKPNLNQIRCSLVLLSNIGCITTTNDNHSLHDDINNNDDGCITSLGKQVAMLPLGVRYSKIILMANKYNIIHYAIMIVSIMSESNIFILKTQQQQQQQQMNEDMQLVDP